MLYYLMGGIGLFGLWLWSEGNADEVRAVMTFIGGALLVIVGTILAIYVTIGTAGILLFGWRQF